MITANMTLWGSRKPGYRLDHRGESSPRAIQIAGADPEQMATAAKINVDNGADIIDINTGYPARKVCTGVDGLTPGRAAQGKPWLLRGIDHYLATGKLLPPPSNLEVRTILAGHLTNLYAFCGEYTGVRVARKHVGWYCKHKHNANYLPARINRAETTGPQLKIIRDYFDAQIQQDLAA